METRQARRAEAAARSIAAAYRLAVDDVQVLHDSNKLTLRLLPCDVLARVAPADDQIARFEIELARRLAAAGCPVAALEPRVGPYAYEQDGFVVTLWTYYASTMPDGLSPAGYAEALVRLHVGMREVDVPAPHFTERVAQAQQLVADHVRTPELEDTDRELLGGTLDALRRAVAEQGAAEQLLHGEPHPGNVLTTANGPLFIDLETCCVGPVEFDLAHAPVEVGDHYPGADQALLRACRLLVLAMITTWRWDSGDQFPDGLRVGKEWLGRIRDAVARGDLDALR